MQTKGKSSGPAGFGQEESIIGPGSSNKQYNQPVTVSTFEETQPLNFLNFLNISNKYYSHPNKNKL